MPPVGFEPKISVGERQGRSPTEESYRLCCVVVCDLETSGMGAPYIYDISRLRVKHTVSLPSIVGQSIGQSLPIRKYYKHYKYKLPQNHLIGGLRFGWSSNWLLTGLSDMNSVHVGCYYVTVHLLPDVSS